MAAYSLSNPATTGTAEAFNAASVGGDSYPLPKPIMLHIKNASAAVRNVTLVAQRACSHGFLHNAVIGPIPAGATWEVPVNQVERFQDDGGKLQLTYDDPAGVSTKAVTT